MVAAGFFQLHLVAKLFHIFPCSLISLVQEILRAAPAVESGNRFPGGLELLCKRHQIVIRAFQLLQRTINSSEQSGIPGIAIQMSSNILYNIQTAGQRCCCSKCLTCTKAKLPCAVATHRQACCQIVFFFIRHLREKFSADFWQFLGNIGPITHSVGCIGIKCEMCGGHNNCNPKLAHITLDRGSALPDCLIVAHSMQKIHGF